MSIEEKTETSPFPVFQDGKTVRDSLSFKIVMGYKGAQPEAGRERFFIVPLNDTAEGILKSAAILHHIPIEERQVEEDQRVCIRMDFSGDNWKDSVLGDRLIIPDEENPDTVPPIDRMKKLITKSKTEYSFQD